MKTLRMVSPLPRGYKIGGASEDFFWKFLFLKHHTAGYSLLSKDNRIEVVRYFSLALSDRILVTELAILVAGTANRFNYRSSSSILLLVWAGSRLLLTLRR